MTFEQVDRYHWRILIADGNIERVLLAAAAVSYDTAPVVLGNDGHDRYQGDFREHIHGGLDQPQHSLSMSIVEGRNCQTYIFNNDGEYWFNAHNFSERANLSAGSGAGNRTIVSDPERFLERVRGYVSIDDVLEDLGP